MTATTASPTPPDPTSLRNRALGLLARRERSRLELTRKLEGLGFEAALVAQTLNHFEAQGWLSDARFASAWIADHRARHGATRLRYDLRQRGVADALIDAALADQPDSEIDRARVVWAKKFGTPPQSPADYAKQVRFMAGRGFSAETLRKLVKPRDD